VAQAVRIRHALLISVDGLEQLVGRLRDTGHAVIGPTRRDGAIVYDEIGSVAELPAGWTDEHAAGRYRLRRRDDAALFGYVVGPHSWKQRLHPPRRRLWRARRDDGRIELVPDGAQPPRYAFLGVRSCDLHAIGVQDRVFAAGTPPADAPLSASAGPASGQPADRAAGEPNAYADTHYGALRERAFVVAVQCTEARGTCFCASMDTGPRARAGYDLALTELVGDGQHRLLVEVGSERGARIMEGVDAREAADGDLALAARASERTAAQMGRRLDTAGLKESLQSNPEHPRWNEVAQRCLACANCTMVCPTCFCTAVEDRSDLDGAHAERWLRWDSCFNPGYAYVHGGSLRPSTRARYRQWLTHKLAHWIDQFGTSGCVGCGRCITWCPAGIDITEEAAAIRSASPAGRAAS